MAQAELTVAGGPGDGRVSSAAVLVLRYYLDLSEREIAETLGIAPGSVKSHAHRGLAKLRTALEGER